MASALFMPFDRGPDGGRLTTPSSDFWNGAGPFGGWVAAVAWRAMAEEAGASAAGMVPRSFSASFLARLAPAPFELLVTPLSRGGSVLQLRVDLRQQGRLCVTAHAVFGLSRPDLEEEQLTRPLPAPQQLPAYEALQPLAAFPRQFDYRISEGRAFEGSASPVTVGWVRLHRETGEAAPTVLGPAELLLLADAWFPPVWTMLDAAVPVATLTLDVLFLRAEVEDQLLADGFLAARHETRRIADGYADEHGLLSLPDGRPVLRAQQLTWVGARAPRSH